MHHDDGAMAVCVHFVVMFPNPIIPVVSYLMVYCQYQQAHPFFSNHPLKQDVVLFLLPTITTVVSLTNTGVLDYERFLKTSIRACGGGGQDFRLHITPRCVLETVTLLYCALPKC